MLQEPPAAAVAGAARVIRPLATAKLGATRAARYFILAGVWKSNTLDYKNAILKTKWFFFSKLVLVYVYYRITNIKTNF